MEPESAAFPCTRVAPPGVADGFQPEWRTEAVVGLLRGIVEDAAIERMPILADALEEAGCTDANLLEHCRAAVAHDAECWALRLLANSEPAASKSYSEIVAEIYERHRKEMAPLARAAEDRLNSMLLTILCLVCIPFALLLAMYGCLRLTA